MKDPDNIIIGYKNLDGSVKSIIAGNTGDLTEKKLFYKYYRTKERVSALIDNGSNSRALGIYISKGELDKNSSLYNLEVTMLPLRIGGGETDKNISFSEDGFLQSQDQYYNNKNVYYHRSVADYLENAEKIAYDEDIFLFDSDTLEWTVGSTKKPLRDSIIECFDEDAEDVYYDYDAEATDEIAAADARTKLINYMDRIDAFIKSRTKNLPVFIDTKTGDLIKIDDPKLLQMYNEVALYARTIGINIESFNVSFVQKKYLSDEAKHGRVKA